MPPFVCGSPCIIDHSFPRDSQELYIATNALGELEQLVKDNKIHLIITEALADLIGEVDWNERANQYALLFEIYRLLQQWFLQPHNRLVRIDTTKINAPNHPFPEGTTDDGWTSFWAEEIGKLLKIHDKVCGANFCVGIACEIAFDTGTPNLWNNPNNQRTFPLVGPKETEKLEDAYTWEELPPNLNKMSVSLKLAFKNVSLLGAIKVTLPPRGSHYKAHFLNARSWTIDVNVDPIPDRFIHELIEITGLPFDVIKTTLIYGNLPKKNVLRLKNYD